MKLCSYGCGRKAKHYLTFKTTKNKWCCEENYRKCPEVIRKNSESNRDRILSKEHKRKIGEANKGQPGYWNGKKLLNEHKRKIGDSNKGKSRNKLTIKKIQKRYPIFSKEEEMKYNADGKIQVHCKYSECPNSKENGGWFTPTKEQIWRRRDSLEHDDGNDGCYFYCSEECKQNCCLFCLKSDPLILSQFEKYIKNVYKKTNKTVENFFNEIENIELRGYKYSYALDHKYSIYDGFINDVDPKIIAHQKNLECIPILENTKKGKKSSITLEELLEDIKKENVLKRGYKHEDK